MSSWMKKKITESGVTEFQPGPYLGRLEKRFGASGAVMLLLDVSSSMGCALKRGKTRLDEAKIGCEGFLRDALAGGYEVGLLLWGSQVEAVVAPSKDGADAFRVLSRASATGGTQLANALQEAGRLLLECDVSDRVVVVFSDGELFDQDRAAVTAKGLAKHGIRIIALGLGDDSASSLSAIVTERSDIGATTSESMAGDIRALSGGLMRGKAKR